MRMICTPAPQIQNASAAARLFFHEDFRKAETTAREFLGIVVADECDPFFADFGKIDFPGKLCQQLGIEPRA